MRSRILAAALAGLSLGACGPMTSHPAPARSSVVASVTPLSGPAFRRAVCDAERRVLALVKEADQTTLASPGDLIRRIGRVQTTLHRTAAQYRANGQVDVAERIAELADAVRAFKQAVAEHDAGTIITAAAKISQAVQGLPLCTTPTPSTPSP